MRITPFLFKRIIAKILDVLGINMLMLRNLNRQYHNNYIRIINYHDTPKKVAANFEKQLQWYHNNFENVTWDKLIDFLNGNYTFTDKPGIMLTFDDGLDANAYVAAPLLERYGFNGVFFISSDLVSKEGYMSWDEVQSLQKKGHHIGCHTATHHRMESTDTPEVLQHEIVDSKKRLEQKLDCEIDSFCWCGGEEEHYTEQAAEVIRRARYQYSFMTNSCPVIPECDRLQLERSNVDAAWSTALMRFQIAGWIDRRLNAKRIRVEAKTKG